MAARWRVLVLAMVLGTVAAVVGVSPAVSAAPVPHHLGPGARGGRGSQLTLAHAPAGLRAAVRKTLGLSAVPAGSAFPQAELTATEGGSGDDFGWSVAISGSTAVVGADGKNSGTGAAYVFVRSGTAWDQQAELTAADAASHDFFGSSVAISGSTAVAGAYGTKNESGAAYVFVRSGTSWSQQAELTDPGAAAGDYFGSSVAISGSTAVVGAPYENAEKGQPVRGTVYVFLRSFTSWSQQAALTASGTAANDLFGSSVAISGSTAVVGAPPVVYEGSAQAVGAAYVFVRSGTAWEQQAALTDPAGIAGDLFGTSVAVSGSTAVVGAPGYYYDNIVSAGAVYLFARSGTFWSQQVAKLGAADAAQSNYFGYSVAVSGSTAVAGAYGRNSGTGTAYAITLPSQQAELTDPAHASASDLFGWSVAMSGSTAVAGTPGRANSAGAAYVFVRSGTSWSQQATLTAADAAPGDSFGYSVAISGSTAVVGAPGKNSGTGAVYVFVRSGTSWSQQAELTAADAASGDDFGYSVAVSGSTAVAGAFGKNSDTGAAYVFARSGTSWSQQATLTAAGAAAGDYFGYSVAVSGSTVVAGAPGKDSGTGAAYVFVRSGTSWSQQAMLTAADAASGDDFGWSVAVSGSTAVAGAPDKNSDTGAAYVFVRSGTSWSQQAELTAAEAPAGAASGDFFGSSVALSGSTAVVGAYGKNSGTGAAFVFASPVFELTPADGASGDNFGWSVAISGSTAVAGGPGKQSKAGAADAGAAYAFVNM